LNRREVAGVLGVIAVFSGAVALVTCPDDSPRPIKVPEPVFTASEDAWLLRQARVNNTLSDSGKFQAPKAPEIKHGLSKKAQQSYAQIVRNAKRHSVEDAQAIINIRASNLRNGMRLMVTNQNAIEQSTLLVKNWNSAMSPREVMLADNAYEEAHVHSTKVTTVRPWRKD
jgi:hypothetical protein